MNLKNGIYGLLRLTQKYTGTDNVYLARGGFWLGSGQMFSMAVAFLSAVAFANLLNPEIYGKYKYILSLAELLEISALVGMGAAVTQAVARNIEGSFYTAFKTKLKWALLGSLGALAGAIYYWMKGNQAYFFTIIQCFSYLHIFFGWQKII
ncbi:oligosaccharide flippase family protein [Candidatus Nomurabacteria bacterium]|nr:oligosaccharide flippase family protein [Candidatus Nomurabacteria bacterium]